MTVLDGDGDELLSLDFPYIDIKIVLIAVGRPSNLGLIGRDIGTEFRHFALVSIDLC